MKASSKQRGGKRSVMYEMNPTHADNNGAEDTAEVQCSFHQSVYDSSGQLKLKTHNTF